MNKFAGDLIDEGAFGHYRQVTSRSIGAILRL
jgi:hypothetical protein